MDPSRPLPFDLQRWSTGHAGVMVPASLAVSAGAPVALLAGCGLLSFSLLLYWFRRRWTPSGRLGAANVVTCLRVAGVALLPWVAPAHLPYWALLLFATDALDGWIARRTGLAGEFGEFADKESDAFLMLMLCILVYRLPGSFGPWILLPGLLRYLFVLFVAVARPPQPKERRSARAGWISTLMILTLIAAFAVYPTHLGDLRLPAMVMTLLLCCSFAASLYEMYGGRGWRKKA